MNDNFFGKKVRLNDYNFTYGKKEVELNIMCFFKYTKDNNLYAVCCEDSNIPYGIMNYGTAHLKGNSLIIIGCKEPLPEMIKELLFKIYNQESLEGFEIRDLSSIEMIELVSPNKFELKKEVLEGVVAKTIPKPVVVETTTIQPKKNKKTVPLILILLIMVGGIFGFLFLNSDNDEDNTVRSIMCKKEYNGVDIEAVVIEDNTYNFNGNDILEYINKSTTYKFYSEDDYLDFVNKGLYYSYIPSDNGGFTLDDENFSLIIIEKEEIVGDYFLPTEYEEVLSYYKNNQYVCSEQLEE